MFIKNDRMYNGLFFRDKIGVSWSYRSSSELTKINFILENVLICTCHCVIFVHQCVLIQCDRLF